MRNAARLSGVAVDHVGAATDRAAILDGLPAHIAFALLDGDGVIVSANEAWRSFASVKGMRMPAASIGVDYLDACDSAAGPDASDVHQIGEGIRAVLDRRAPNFAVEYACRSALEQRWFASSVAPISSEGALVMHVDITARKQAAYRTQQTLETLEEAQRVANIGDWNLDLATGAMTWSRQLYEILGRDPDLGPPKSLEEHIPTYSPASRTIVAEKVRRAIATGELQEYDVVALREHGRQVFVHSVAVPKKDETGVVRSIHGTVQDISARIRAQSELRQREAELRETQRLARLGSWYQESDGGNVRWSEEMSTIFRFVPPVDEVSYADLRPLFTPAAFERFAAAVTRTRDTGESYEFEAEVIRADGSPGWVLTRGEAVRDGSGNVIAARGTVLDITEKHAAEDELRASNEKFHQIASNVNDVFWSRSPDMTELHYLSPGFERIWGRKVETLLAEPKSWKEFIAPEDRERVIAAFDGLQKDAPSLDIEYRIVRPDGEIRWIRAREFQVRDDAGTHVRNIGVATDITEKQLATAALQRSAEEYKSIAEALQKSERDQRLQAEQLELERSRLVAAQQVAKIGSWETDLASLRVQWSDEMYRIFGVDAAEPALTYSSVLEWVHPEDRALVDDAFDRSVRERGTRSVEHRLLLTDGTVKTVEERWQIVADEEGKPLRAQGTCQDITERRQAEDALRQSQKRLRDVFDGLGPSVFVALLSADGIVVEINRSPLDAAGLRAEEVLGRPFDETHWWTYSPEVRSRLRAAIGRARGGESARYDVEIRGARDQVIDIDFSLEPLRDESGNISFLIASASVITERKIAEAALRQAQKMEAVGQLAAGVAHEFNNLLQAMMSTSAILRYQSAMPLVAKSGIDLESLVNRGAALTRQLLLFARNSAIEKSDVDLGLEVRTASAFLRALMPETIAIFVDLPPDPLSADADAGQIQQVLLNLAINARDAMPEGGTLTLRAGRAGDEVFLEVEDTGHGMSAETVAHLFEPFFSTKKPGKGTGLGLAVAHGIAERHGGRFEVQSNLAEGSRFRMILPALASPVVLTPANPAEPDLMSGAGRIFLVEDDAPVREGVSTLLELMGYDVITAGSGEEALTLTIDPPPQLLLSDVTLSGLPGPRVATLLRERWPDLKIVLMSGYFEETMQSNASRDGWHFLQKPFELDTLARVVAAAMEDARLQTQ